MRTRTESQSARRSGKLEVDMEPEELMFFGDPVKALGDGKVAGYLVRFGTPKDHDLTNDFFSKETDLGVEEDSSLPVYYQHGFDSQLKNRKIGRGRIKYDDIGAWFEAQLELRDEYERAIYELAENGKLAWSSGAAGHLVEKEPIGKSWHIKSWPIAEASLTPTPAEPRNTVSPVKSIYDPAQDQEDIKMNDEELQAILTKTAEEVAAKTAETMLKAFQEKKSDVTAGFQIEVTDDEADRALRGNPFKKGEFFKAVKAAALYPQSIDKRLLPLKASGLNETVPSEGGFLVSPDIAAGIQEKMWGVGTILSLFAPSVIEVSSNALTLNVVDESSRKDGYRTGGVLGYWMEEGGTKSASKPKFEQVDLKLKKVAALCYATDELLEDVVALESWINNTVPNELRFQTEAAIVNGNGVGKPLGMLQAPCLISATRTDANEIDVYDITRMWSRRYLGASDYVWMINSNVTPQLYTITLGNMPIFLPPGGLSGSMYGSMMGRPVIETEYNPGLGTLGDILLASPSQYAIISKGGIQSASSIHVQFLTDETTFRFVYRVDGEPTWKSSVTAYATTDTISPFVALAATT